MAFYTADDEPDSFISVELIYNDDDVDLLHQKKNYLFDFNVEYTRAPQVDSDGDEHYENLDALTVHKTDEFDIEWLIPVYGDQIEAIVYEILDLIHVPYYNKIVGELTDAILELKNLYALCELSTVDSVQVTMEVVARRFSGEDDVDDDDDDDDEDDDDDDDDDDNDDDDDDMVNVDVKLAVAPASDEAVENHLETVVVENEGSCVICMDKIRVGSDLAAGRMPCLHVFHRTCGEEWLRTSGTSPVCRSVFPS